MPKKRIIKVFIVVEGDKGIILIRNELNILPVFTLKRYATKFLETMTEKENLIIIETNITI